MVDEANHITDFDMDSRPLLQDNTPIKYKRPLDKRMFNIERGVVLLLIGAPGVGKTYKLLELFSRESHLRYYFEKIHFFCASPDKTLSALFNYYGEPISDISDSSINQIIQNQLDEDEDEVTGYPRTNCCIVVDDALSMNSFKSRNDTAISKLAGNFRHILRGHLPYKVGEKDNFLTHGGGGMLVISSQRYESSIPRNVRACASTIFIGRMANKEENYSIIKEFDSMFGDHMREMLNYALKDRYSFLALYITGDLDPESGGQPVAYKWGETVEKLYPSERFPEKKYEL